MKGAKSHDAQNAAFVRDQEVCMICGRRGTRAFIVVSGKAGEAATQVMCENRAACDRRAKAAIRHEAARGNWS